MKICLLCTQDFVNTRIKQHFSADHDLIPFRKEIESYVGFDLILIVEPVRIKGQYLSVYDVWKLFLSRHAPKTKLLVMGFASQSHRNFISLLELHDGFDLQAATRNALSCTDEWGESYRGNGYDKINSKLRLFFKGHNYNSIIDAGSKVRQLLNNAELSLYGSTTLNRDKEEFRIIWEQYLWPKRKYLRHFYSRWYNYKDFFDWLPFFSQLERVQADQFITELQQLFSGSKIQDEEELLIKETQYKKLDPFNNIRTVIRTFSQIDSKYIDPSSIGPILLIDDDEDFHHQLNEDLPNFTFHSIYSKEEVKDLDKEEVFHLILLDLELTKRQLDGLDLIPKLKSLYPDTPLSIITVYDDRSAIQHTINEGANFFLSKPQYSAEKWNTLFISLITKRKFSIGEILIFNQTLEVTDKPNILVIEDETEWYERIAELSEGFSFSQANTVKQARDMLKGGTFDLILLDLYFVIEGRKIRQGLEFIPEVKNNYPDIPLIVVSYETDPKILKAIEENRVDRYLKKEEFDSFNWLGIIEAFVDLKKARDKAKAV